RLGRTAVWPIVPARETVWFPSLEPPRLKGCSIGVPLRIHRRAITDTPTSTASPGFTLTLACGGVGFRPRIQARTRFQVLRVVPGGRRPNDRASLSSLAAS